MLRRVTAMAFAPNVLVFPGGGVDRRDADGELPWVGPAPEQWADRLGCSEPEARTIVSAAVRELFEECGVFLASPAASPDGALVDGSDPRWIEVRAALVAKDRSMSDVLREYGLVLRSDLLAAKAHWVPPEYVSHRFSTWFFAALMPTNQQADGNTSESQHAEWVSPATVLAGLDEQHSDLMPPTYHSLESLAAAGSAQAFVRHTEPLLHVLPQLVRLDSGELAVQFDLPDPSSPGR